MSQQRLALAVAQSTTLVTVDTARAVLGMDAESIAALCESGRLAWAFDLKAAGHHRREIRIWCECLSAYQSGIHVPGGIDEALDSIIGHSFVDWIPCTRVAQRFCVHRRSVYRWAEGGVVITSRVDHTVRVLRASLASFLASRRIR